MDNQTKKEFYFGEFTRHLAYELGVKNQADIIVKKGAGGYVVFVYFYEKKVLRGKKYSNTVVATIPNEGDIIFAGAITNSSTLGEPVRFLKYLIAQSLDRYNGNNTELVENVYNLHYSAI